MARLVPPALTGDVGRYVTVLCCVVVGFGSICNNDVPTVDVCMGVIAVDGNTKGKLLLGCATDAITTDAPAGDTPTGDVPTGDAPKGEAPMQDAPAGDASRGDSPMNVVSVVVIPPLSPPAGDFVVDNVAMVDTVTGNILRSDTPPDCVLTGIRTVDSGPLDSTSRNTVSALGFVADKVSQDVTSSDVTSVYGVPR